MLTYKFTQTVMKILFSCVLIQLFLIILASEACPDPLMTIEALEYSAMSAVLTLGGGMLMEYAVKNNS